MDVTNLAGRVCEGHGVFAQNDQRVRKSSCRMNICTTTA